MGFLQLLSELWGLGCPHPIVTPFPELLEIGFHNLSYLSCISCSLWLKSIFQPPAEVVVVDHIACHATINADVLARDEAGLVGGKVEHHVCDVHRIADAPGEVL